MRVTREAIRARYRPERVTILFVGESPPASGRFFYSRNSGLYRAMLNAFQRADGSVTDENFLERFQRSGCYLIDACHRPVDHMEPIARRNACTSGERGLADRIRDLQPHIIISLVRSIRKNVENATRLADWRGTLLNTPYPGRWIRHREAFVFIVLPYLQAAIEKDRPGKAKRLP